MDLLRKNFCSIYLITSFLILCAIRYSPDILPMIGPSLQPNMWLAVGFAYGIVHGGAVGHFLSNWILNGEPGMYFLEISYFLYFIFEIDKRTTISLHDYILIIIFYLFRL